MNAQYPKPTIGKGIYTIPDISKILQLPNYRIRYWINEFWNHRFSSNSLKSYSWGEGREKATSFYTLIEFYTFYQLRQNGLSAQKILNAHDVISKKIDTPFPFASSIILTDGKFIFFSIDDMSTLIHADKSLQSLIIDIIKTFCKKIEFNSSKLAERYYPLGKNNTIVVDPHHQFGQPTIKNTNLLTETVYNIYIGTKSIKSISKLYDINSNQIKDVIKFHAKSIY